MQDHAAHRRLILVCASLMFFVATAGAFTSLGVVLPSMVRDLGWSWSQAGAGYTCLGLACGLSGYLPAILIRRIGVRAAVAIGAGLLSAGFVCLFITQGLALYYLGTVLEGVGYTLATTAPAMFMLARWFPDRRALAVGVYYTIGGLGGVAGPWLFFGLLQATGDWRIYWAAFAVAAAAVGALAALVSAAGPEPGPPARSPKAPWGAIWRSTLSWSGAEATRTPQFVLIATAFATFLLVGTTVNSFSVAHLTEHGLSARAAGGFLSLQALVNALARVGGGVLAERIEPRWLLVVSLSALAIGSAALSVSHDGRLATIYALGVGVGYGLTFLSGSVLLLNYFGPDRNLELFSVVNLAGAPAALGPLIGGLVRDRFGGFGPTFLVFAGLAALVALAAARMRPPVLPGSRDAIAFGPDAPSRRPT